MYIASGTLPWSPPPGWTAVDGKGLKAPSEAMGREGQRDGGTKHMKREAEGRSQGPSVGGGRKGKHLFCLVALGPSCALASEEVGKLSKVKATACPFPSLRS